MSKISVSLAVVFLLSLFAVPAFAQDDDDAVVMQACQSNIQQFCAGQSGDALFDCLDENYDQLSDACKQAFDTDDDDEGDDSDDQEDGQ